MSCLGPAPVTDFEGPTSATAQIAILAKNADGISFEQLKQEMNGKQYDHTSRSACDALLAYFYDLSMGGEKTTIDYYFVNNLLKGEGGDIYF